MRITREIPREHDGLSCLGSVLLGFLLGMVAFAETIAHINK